MRIWLLAMSLWCASTVMDAHAAGKGEETIYIGTHGAASGPQGASQAGLKQGVYVSRLDVETGRLSPASLAVELQRSTWLAVHPTLPIIYSVAQGAGGTDSTSDIYSFRVDETSGSLRLQSKAGAGGHDATFMDVDTKTNSLFIANYGSGSVTVLPLKDDGSLGTITATQEDQGSGPHRRQKSAHAHAVAMDPTHRFVVVSDLGADRLFVYEFDRATHALKPAKTPSVSFPPGSGPRHLVFHPTNHTLYVNTELTGELRSFTWNRKGELKPLQTLSPYAADFSGEKSGGEIGLSPNGKTLYLSLRGDQDVLVAYTIDGRSGLLSELERVPSGGKAPWSFGIDPSGRWMLVTNEASSTVNVFSVDHATGQLRATGESLEVPKPVTVAFFKH